MVLTYSNVTNTATKHCNTLQHTATHCNTLQHPAKYNWSQLNCVRIQPHVPDSFLIYCNNTATHCNIPQHTAPYCNTLQHTTELSSIACGYSHMVLVSKLEQSEVQSRTFYQQVSMAHDSHIRDMTHPYTWLIHTWHDTFTRDMNHSYVLYLFHTLAPVDV